MKKFLVFALALILVVGFASMAFAGVSGSKHDLVDGPAAGANGSGTGTTQICVFCHHPHRGDVATGNSTTKDTVNVKNDLLWNMDSFSQDEYETYSNPTSMGATNAGAAINNANAPASFLCMACHDGVIAASSLVALPADGTANNSSISISGYADLGTTLADDHPVNFDYPNGTDAYIKDPTAGEVIGNIDATNTYPLFSGKMQCGTCHDVHAGENSKAGDLTTGIQFMRGDIAGSLICRDCHIAK